MATKVLSNEFMQNIATEEAWKEFSFRTPIFGDVSSSREPNNLLRVTRHRL